MIARQLYQPDITTPPGETIADLLEEKGMTLITLARRMGANPGDIGCIVTDGQEIIVETALQLERVLGIPTAYLLKHERAYQEYMVADKDSI